MKNLWIKSLAVLGIVLALTACSSGGNCKGCNSGGSTPIPPSPGNLSLNLTAPAQFPAGVPVTAYLTMTNTSEVNAHNLIYSIPTTTNYTGTIITVNNNNNPCKNITAGQNCTFPVQITNNPVSHPGSFTITATPGNTANNSILSTLKSAIGIKSEVLSLTANIGLSNVPLNSQSGANGITFLYANTIAKNSNGSTLVSIVAYVNSAAAGAFNTINLTDINGGILSNVVAVSGNSGPGLTDLSKGAIISFVLTLPAGTSNYTFYGQTLKNGVLQSQGTTPNQINLVDSSAGILVVQPTEFNLYASESYTSQIITYSNIGNAQLTNLNIQTPSGPFSLTNNCGTTLSPNSSCNVTLTSNTPTAISSSSSIVATSSGGAAVAQFNYAGANPVEGISLSGSNNFVFNSANTVNDSETSQLTLTNAGNVSESSFIFNFDSSFFTLSPGTNGIPCAISNGNIVEQTITPGSSCTLTLTYTNPAVANAGIAVMTVNYNFNGKLATPATKTITYSTSQAVANLNVTVPSLPYTFTSIPANNIESKTTVFTFTNSGPDSTTSINLGNMTGDTSYFAVQPATSNDCRVKQALAVGGTCTLTIKFGPSSTPKEMAQMTIPLTVNSVTGGITHPNLVAQGTVVLSGAILTFANITGVADIATNGFSGGDGSSATPYMLAANSNGTLTYTITNIGNGNATNLSIVSPAGSGTFDTANSSCKFDPNAAPLAIGDTCTAKFIYNQASGSENIGVNPFGVIYNDQTYPTAPRYQLAVVESSMNINFYPVPTVTARLTKDESGLIPINGQLTENMDFYAIYTLAGGYQVPNQTYTVTPNSLGSTPMSVYSPITCSVNSLNNSCKIKINSGSVANNESIVFTTQNGAISPSPSNENFNVLTTLYIFVSRGTTSGGDLGGFAGADAFCNSDPKISSLTVPVGTTWKALLRGNNSTIPGYKYQNITNETIAFADSGDLVGPGNIINPIDASSILDSAWTGGYANDSYKYSNCNDWTNSSSSVGGIAGSPYATDINWWGQPYINTCDANWPVYCVQQPLSLSIEQSYFDRTEQDGTFKISIPSPVTFITSVSVTSADDGIFEIVPPTTCSIPAGNSDCTVNAKSHSNQGSTLITASANGYINGTLNAEITP